MAGLGVAGGVRTSISLETTCGALLQELETIWTEIGESEEEKDQMLLELEKECMKVYQRKVDEAMATRAQLHQSLVAKEAEVASLMALLDEQGVHMKTGDPTSLKEKLGLLKPVLEDLSAKKDGRIKQFSDLLSQIRKLNAEIIGFSHCYDAADDPFKIEEHNLSTRKLAEYQAKLRNLQKEKSDRLHKVMEQVKEVHSLCGVLGMDFRTIVEKVHPSLHKISIEQSTNISDTTMAGLAEVILKLETEKKMRTQKLRDAAKTLSELSNLMDSSEEDRKPFEVVMNMLGHPEVDVTCSGVLSMETIQQMETEIDRLTRRKVGRMQELVLKKRAELEEICINTHIEPAVSTAPEKVCALLASCLVDPSELLANIEAQITKVKEESMIRKEIIDRVSKWLLACEEEDWLEEYDKDANKYSVGRGAHLNLKRAEKARVTASKIPAIVDNLTNKVFAWEDGNNSTFLYDGVPLMSLFEDYKFKRQEKEEEKRRDREHKKLQNLLLTEKEAVYGSKPTPKRSNSLRRNGNGNGFMTPSPRRNSVGSATLNGNGYFKETRRLSAAPLNFVAIAEEVAVPSFASVAGSPPRN